MRDKIAVLGAVAFVLVTRVVQISYDYLPGRDIYNRAAMTQNVLEHGVLSTSKPGFHGLVAGVHTITGIPIISLHQGLGIVSFCLLPVVVWFIARKMFDKNVATLASPAIVLLHLAAYYQYASFQLNFFITSSLLMPLALFFLVRRNSIRDIILGSILALMIILSHRLTTMMFVSVLVLWMGIELFQRRDTVELSKRQFTVSMVSFNIIFIIAYHVFLVDVVEVFLSTFNGELTVITGMIVSSRTIIEKVLFLNEIIFIPLGLVALWALVYDTDLPHRKLFIAWCFALGFGVFSPNYPGLSPLRFIKALAIPVTLVASYAVWDNRKRQGIIILGLLAVLQAGMVATVMSTPDPIRQYSLDSEHHEAASWIDNQNGTTLTSQYGGFYGYHSDNNTILETSAVDNARIRGRSWKVSKLQYIKDVWTDPFGENASRYITENNIQWLVFGGFPTGVEYKRSSHYLNKSIQPVWRNSKVIIYDTSFSSTPEAYKKSPEELVDAGHYELAVTLAQTNTTTWNNYEGDILAYVSLEEGKLTVTTEREPPYDIIGAIAQKEDVKEVSIRWKS